MEKVKVAKEVATEIEYAKEEFRSIAAATQYLLNEADLTDEQVDQALRGYYAGYEIEKTPEEKVREYFESLIAQEEAHERMHESGAQFRQGWQAVYHTLEMLGIKIEGVNA